MSTVFISYRREIAAGEARALFSDLVERLGQDSVFMDVDSIALGRDFRSVLQKTLDSCDRMLVLIGRDLADVKDEAGRGRLGNPNDFVRLEIEAALKRDIVVTPVLVQGAHMPTAEQLPAEIRDLAYRNGFELSHSRWESDVREMIRRLSLDVPEKSRQVETPPPPPLGRPTERTVPAAQPKRKQRLLWGLVPALIIVAIGGGLLMRSTPHPPKEAPDSYVALGAFNKDTKAYPYFRLASGTSDDVKIGDIIEAKTPVNLRTNTEKTDGDTNPSLATIPDGGCVKVIERRDNIRGQTWAAVKRLPNCG